MRVAGNIGYGIRPSARRRGLAAWAVGQMLDEARVRGLNRVLITCGSGQVAAQATAGTPFVPFQLPMNPKVVLAPAATLPL